MEIELELLRELRGQARREVVGRVGGLKEMLGRES